MLNVNWTDVLNVLVSCRPYLIFLGIVLVLGIVVMIISGKMWEKQKSMIRCQAGVGIVLALIITINMICTGPMSSIVTLATGNGKISEESSAEAKGIVDNIADEGIVLLKNDSSELPLKDKKQINVFGWASTNPCYGGTGSGSLSTNYPKVSLLDGLRDSGFELNTELSDFYTQYRAERPSISVFEQDWTLPEPEVESYPKEMIDSAKSFSDTAMIVITRVGGEGADLPMDVNTVTYNNNSSMYADFPEGSHYLELSQTEKNMMDMVCSNFNNVILVYNGANTFELGFLDNYKQIKSVIWCPGTGQNGFDALGRVISGEVNPSAKTPDTFIEDFEKAPNYKNFGSFVYDNMSEFQGDINGIPSSPTFINYVDGIYVGYKFYETAAQEGLIDYDSTVVYPFGYGLSYTTFSQEMGELSRDENGKISLNVTVTNTGSVAGKDVVEVYNNPPYYNGGIEKTSVNLIAFDKTDIIQPGESQVVSIEFNEEDMASYDEKGEKCYVLEAGDYGISIRSDAHTIIDEKVFTQDKTITYDENNKRSTDNVAAVNQFELADDAVTYLSRMDGFANYDEATAAPTPASLSMSEENKAKFINNSNYKSEDYNNASDVMPVTDAKNGMKLADLRGADYDDPAWDSLLNQLSISDMNNLIALGGFQTAEVKSVGKQLTSDCDGPAAINNYFTRVSTIGFPSAVMIASTWNEDLALAFGEGLGKMADEMGVSGWYGPSMNIHRSQFGGRNFEYYSEDGLLSGKIATQAVLGAKKYGIYAYVKHFALNDQETNRLSMICTWANEQSIRELYFKPFEMVVKDGKTTAVMSSFNYIGTTYAGGNNALLNTVLRDEWGFRGMVLSDWFGGYGYQNSDQLIRNGNDICLTNIDIGTNFVKDTSSATSILAMRQSSKNIMYTVVNSRAYNDENASGLGLLNWQIILIAVDVLIILLLAGIEVLVIKKYKKKSSIIIEKENN